MSQYYVFTAVGEFSARSETVRIDPLQTDAHLVSFILQMGTC